ELIGGGNLILQNTAALEMDNDIVNHQITKGRTHLFDTRITGDEALTSLRNRKERITSLCEWMLSLNGPRQQSIKDFDKHWKPLLFPEMVRSSQRPSGWRQEGDIFERSSDISWNTGFTDRVFPEELRPVRNSGTLLRDWEEALSWVYYQYEWENITALLSGRIILNKIK
ncbi:MAG: hypothetical protein FWB83_09970, partial [Treponema sp.]|nr:hypothetical protein [Treponema sp.]